MTSIAPLSPALPEAGARRSSAKVAATSDRSAAESAAGGGESQAREGPVTE
jgi:hypothetical protein